MIVGTQALAAYEGDGDTPSQAPTILEVATLLETAPRECHGADAPWSELHVRMSDGLCNRLAQALREDHARIAASCARVRYMIRDSQR